MTVVDYIRAGPREILAGPYIPNNHELYSLLSWATTSLVGESEIAIRLWSVIPFIAGVVLVTGWLQVRVSTPAALLYLFFTTLLPLLLDLSRQARGYGLAFLAMSVLMVAAWEANSNGRTWTIVTFCAAGVLGTWTLPIFGISFFATGTVLLIDPLLRRRLAVGLAASTLPILAWYAPHYDDLLMSSQQEFGAPIPWFGIVTAPIDQIIIPSLIIEGVPPTTSLAWLPLIGAIALVLVSSPLLRNGRTALILGSGIAATLIVVWTTRLYLVPRFVSYLLVPLCILLATGTTHMLARTHSRRPGVRTIVAFTMLAVVTVQFGSAAGQIARLPREAHKDAANLVESRAPPGSAVLAYTHHPLDLAFYLDRPVHALEESEVVSGVCGRRGPVVYVTQPAFIRPVEVPCLRRDGVRHFRFAQYTRGLQIDVWFVPSRD